MPQQHPNVDTYTEAGIRIDEDGDVSTYAPAFDNLRNQDLFTRTLDEEFLPQFSTDLTAWCRSPRLDARFHGLNVGRRRHRCALYHAVLRSPGRSRA